MKIFDGLINKKVNLAVVGLGYVGFPIAYEFAKKGIYVIGFDTNEEKILKYKKGIDSTLEVGDFDTESLSIKFTSDERELKSASFYIVAVPTPINTDNTPNLVPVINACKIIGKNLNKKSIVVFESTVYPGVT